MEHKSLTQSNIHTPFRWVWADSTARLETSDIEAQDVRKVGYQQDEDSIWVLKQRNPVVWEKLNDMSVTWVWPTLTERNNTVVTAEDLYRIGYLENRKELFVLTEVSPSTVWTRVGSKNPDVPFWWREDDRPSANDYNPGTLGIQRVGATLWYRNDVASPNGSWQRLCVPPETPFKWDVQNRSELSAIPEGDRTEGALAIVRPGGSPEPFMLETEVWLTYKGVWLSLYGPRHRYVETAFNLYITGALIGGEVRVEVKKDLITGVVELSFPTIETVAVGGAQRIQFSNWMDNVPERFQPVETKVVLPAGAGSQDYGGEVGQQPWKDLWLYMDKRTPQTPEDSCDTDGRMGFLTSGYLSNMAEYFLLPFHSHMNVDTPTSITPFRIRYQGTVESTETIT